MTQQLKNDIRTIIEVSAFILFTLSISFINIPVISYLLLVIWLGFTFYRLFENIQYRRGKRPDMIRFATQNDNFSKTTLVAAGILILACTMIGCFKPYTILGFIVGIIVVLIGIINSPKGWINIDRNLLHIFNGNDNIDIRQLKEVILKNDMISFVNIYGEYKNTALLNLNPSSAAQLKEFFSRKLPKEVTYVDEVQ